MKKIVLAAIALVFSASIFAQAPQRGERREFKPEEMAKHQTDRMKKELNLTDEQYKSVYALFIKQGEEMKALHAKREQSQPETRREEMKKQREAMNAEMKKILTAEQYTKYEEMQKRLHQRGPGQGGPRGLHAGQGGNMPPRN